MNNKPNNPLAFPNQNINARTVADYNGMTLLDWFAGQAMQGLVNPKFYTSEEVFTESQPKVARMAYITAQAMLAEREKHL